MLHKRRERGTEAPRPGRRRRLAGVARGQLLIQIKGRRALSEQLPMVPLSEIRRGLKSMGRDNLLFAISVAWLFVVLGVAVYIIVI